MRLITPFFNALRQSQRYCSTAHYQAVFQNHGVPLTPEEAFVPGNLSAAEHVKAILDKPEVKTKWCAAKNGYSTLQQRDKLSYDINRRLNP